MRRWLVVVVLASACSYGPGFRDCEIGCGALNDCPTGFSCGGEGLCRVDGFSATCAEVLGDAGADDAGEGGALASLAYVKASNTQIGDQFGFALALSADGRTLAVGAPVEASASANQQDNSAASAGAVYVYVRSGASWAFQAYVKASNPNVDDVFGSRLALSADGDTLAVGAPGEDSAATGIDGAQGNNAAGAAGAAYVFVRAGTTWNQQAYVKASNTDANDGFGTAVALSADGSTLAVGAEGEASADPLSQGDNSAGFAGAAYVFVRTGVSWSQQAYVKASAPAADERFGRAIALSADGNTLAAGAPGHGVATIARAGGAFVFVRTGATWTQQAVLASQTPGPDDSVGAAIAVSGDGNTLVAGAPLEDSGARTIGGDETDNAAPDAGAAYVFRRSGTEWAIEAYIKAPNTDAGDELGHSVALSDSGNTLLVGASSEDSGALRIGGDADDNTAAEAGAAYLLVRTGTTWAHRAYVKASNTAQDNLFGSSVALSADASTAAIGAADEGSPSTGVDGDQRQSTRGAGAAYVYF